MLLRARSRGWRVVVFNSRGCGDSPVTTPQVLSFWSFITLVDWYINKDLIFNFVPTDTTISFDVIYGGVWLIFVSVNQTFWFRRELLVWLVDVVHGNWQPLLWAVGWSFAVHTDSIFWVFFVQIVRWTTLSTRSLLHNCQSTTLICPLFLLPALCIFKHHTTTWILHLTIQSLFDLIPLQNGQW